MDTTTTDPIAIYNVFHGTVRTMVSMSTAAIAVIAFGNTFSNDVFIEYIIKTLGGVIFIISLIFGYKSANEFSRYIAYLKQNKATIPYIKLSEWESWIYITYTYLVIISIISMIFFFVRIYKNKLRFTF